MLSILCETVIVLTEAESIINEHADDVLKTATVEILKRSFLNEIQRGD